MLDFHVSWRGNSIDAYLFIRRPVHKYGRVPIYADACRWAGVEHVVYGHPLKNLMSEERMIQYVEGEGYATLPAGSRVA